MFIIWNSQTNKQQCLSHILSSIFCLICWGSLSFILFLCSLLFHFFPEDHQCEITVFLTQMYFASVATLANVASCYLKRYPKSFTHPYVVPNPTVVIFFMKTCMGVWVHYIYVFFGELLLFSGLTQQSSRIISTVRNCSSALSPNALSGIPQKSSFFFL